MVIALSLDGTPRLIVDHTEPTRGAGEALLRMRLAGICDTDLQLVRGYMQYRGILGHEAVAEVLEADEPSWVGKRVVVDINAGCGSCADCIDDAGHHCQHRSVLGISGRDGVFAERFTMKERCLVEVPDAVPDDCAVFAEPLAAALHVLDELDPELDDRAVVVGDGKLGLLIGMVLANTGMRVTQIGHHREKLALLEPYGVETRLDPDDVAHVPRTSFVVEATGTNSGLSLAMRLVEPRGTIVLKTTTAANNEVSLAPLVIDEVSLVGSRCGDLGMAIDWLAAGRVVPTPLIAARYPLVRADEALQHAGMRNVLKVLITGS